jgi:hypothetical protein
VYCTARCKRIARPVFVCCHSKCSCRTSLLRQAIPARGPGSFDLSTMPAESVSTVCVIHSSLQRTPYAVQPTNVTAAVVLVCSNWPHYHKTLGTLVPLVPLLCPHSQHVYYLLHMSCVLLIAQLVANEPSVVLASAVHFCAGSGNCAMA